MMFKLKLSIKATQVRCLPGDIITCNLPDGPENPFYVRRVTPHGVIIGNFLSISAYIYDKYDGQDTLWLYGENYNKVCSAVPT